MDTSRLNSEASEDDGIDPRSQDRPLWVWRALVAGAVLFLTLPLPGSVQAAIPTQPPRWVRADEVRVRAGPSAEFKIVGRLSRGAELILKDVAERDGFCLIEGEGQYGYVSCGYLSAEPVARPRAGEGGVDSAQRWVSGNGVTLRDAPRRDAAVVDRLALNVIVTLLREAAGNGYCEVRSASGPSGYTACRYLVSTPVVLAHVRGDRRADEALSPDYDPERVFWLEPGWAALEQYAEHLKTRHPDIPPQGPWPRDEALERMKAHLALGLKGRRPQRFADWSDLKRTAAQDRDLSGETSRLQAQGKKVAEADWQREGQMQQTASELQTAIGLWGPLHDAHSGEGNAARIFRLVRALEFPGVKPSLFRSDAELAPPNASTEEASGRFDMVFRQQFTPRPSPGSDEGSGPGLYDMLARTQLLVRPVHRVQLFRDGRLDVEPSLVRTSETLWRDVDEPMCSGWSPGFAYGDADAGLWRYVEAGMAMPTRPDEIPVGSLFAFYTTIDLPPGPASRSETPMTLARADTGFVGGTYLHYDFDRDGVFDLAVWEGKGNGPGHLEGPTATDDRWYRLALVNIDGAWKVLGSDVFGYGCGC